MLTQDRILLRAKAFTPFGIAERILKTFGGCGARA
jgi:hypothetical protein